jgi:hypothetical protein
MGFQIGWGEEILINLRLPFEGGMEESHDNLVNFM